jgi:hypothetical protein
LSEVRSVFLRRRLPDAAAGLLKEVTAKRRPELLQSLSSLPEVSLSETISDILREMLLDEFMETGRKPDDEPNARGLEIEDLIDKLQSWE